MVRVTKQFVTETAHRLLGHPGLCRFIHGHSYKWEVTVEGELQQGGESAGMVIDFKHLKKAMEDTLEKFDHAIVLHEDDPILMSIQGITDRLICFESNPTAENFAKYAFYELRVRGINVINVRVWETATSYADYGENN